MNQIASSPDLFSRNLDLQSEISFRKRVEARAAFLEEFNRLLVESAGDCIVVVDDEGIVESINQTACRVLQAEQLASPAPYLWTSLFPELETRPFIAPGNLPLARTAFEATSRTPQNGELRFWSMSFTPFPALPGAPNRFLLVARDVTEHMLAERALRQSEEAFRKIFEENPIGILLLDLSSRITKANDALSAMLGFSQDELRGKTLADLIENPARHTLDEDFLRLLRGDVRSFQTEIVFLTKRKQQVWGHVTASVLRNEEGAPVAVFQMIENIQDRKSTEEQVLCYQEQLQTLASELSFSEERERRRIATNLHDRIGQSLAFARLELAALCESEPRPEFRRLRELIDEAIVDTRSLTFELSPPVLYELGLVAALEWLVHKIRKDHGIQTRFHDDGLPKPLDENFRVVLFQAVRELLVNIVKHARASHAQVVVRRDADALRILIEDDGVGFELPRAKAKREASRSFGLFNIRERVEYLGGQLKIRSEIGRGTRVTLIAPLKIEALDENLDEHQNRNRRRPQTSARRT
jgi:PAS domain S-box-containing protein